MEIVLFSILAIAGGLVLINSKIGEELLDEKMKSLPGNDESRRKVFAAVDKYSAEYNVKKSWLLAFIEIESNFHPGAVGDLDEPRPSYGLLQIQESTYETVAKIYGASQGWKDGIDANVRVGAQYMRFILDRYPVKSGGDMRQAWVWGPTGYFINGRYSIIEELKFRKAVISYV